MNRNELLQLLKPVQNQFEKVDEELNKLHIALNHLEREFLRVGKVPKEIDTIKGKKTIWVEEDEISEL